MNRISVLAVLMLSFAMVSEAGVFSGAKEVVKGAAKDTAVAVKTVSYPARHPKKAAKATGKGVKASAKAVAKL